MIQAFSMCRSTVSRGRSNHVPQRSRMPLSAVAMVSSHSAKSRSGLWTSSTRHFQPSPGGQFLDDLLQPAAVGDRPIQEPNARGHLELRSVCPMSRKAGEVSSTLR